MTSAPERVAVLVLCTANICRSPLAERLLTAFCTRHGDARRVVTTTSAGTRAHHGDPAAPGMVRIAERWGLDLSQHRSRPVGADLVSRADVVLTMEAPQRDAAARLAPRAATRCFTLPELALLVGAAGPVTGTIDEQVAAWGRERARTSTAAPDVDDPYDGPEAGYVTTARRLASLVEVVGPALVG